MRQAQLDKTPLALLNPDKAWVAKELDLLLAEWKAWQREVDQIVDHAYDESRQSEVFADGEENMGRHGILQAKTLVFLDNNIVGHGFIIGRDGNHIDRNDLRLKVRVKHRLRDLNELSACLQYARVPEAYWKGRAKELLAKIIGKTPEVATEIATRYLKGTV